MFSYYRAARRLAKERDAALKDAQVQRDEAARLRRKLDERSDFFIEREMRLIDRFLTSQVKTYAITDEIKSKARIATEEEVKDGALDDFLADKKAFLVQCAREAGMEKPEEAAKETFEQNYSAYVLEFQGQ